MRDFGCPKLFIASLSRTALIDGNRAVATRQGSCRSLPADSTLSVAVPGSIRNHRTATAHAGRLACESAIYAQLWADSTYESPVPPLPRLIARPL